jgi:hypothetical protein
VQDAVTREFTGIREVIRAEGDVQESSAEIGNLVKVITSLAEQTNLLVGRDRDRGALRGGRGVAPGRGAADIGRRLQSLTR